MIQNNQLTVTDVICDVVFVNSNTANTLLMNFDNFRTKHVLRLN